MPYGLCDQDRLDGLSNFSICKARILTVLEAYELRDHAESVLATPTDVALLAKHNETEAHDRSFIMDGVKDHVVPHIVEKRTANGMWKSLTTLYQGKSVHKKMLLEN